MRPAADLLLIEAAALRPILERTPEVRFNLPTVCSGWSVRDVLAHCGAALSHVAEGTVHRFTPDDNERDVEIRRQWELRAVLDELWRGYEAGAAAIDAAGGRLDGVGIGEWMHGGDVRDALGEPGAYVGDGSDLALQLLLERSRTMERPAVALLIDHQPHRFGVGDPGAHLATDLETFVRLTGNRRPDPDRYWLESGEPADLVLFS